jgi:hypothetical protein
MRRIAKEAVLLSKLVPGEGFEPPTFGLQNRCTTTVLTRRSGMVPHLVRDGIAFKYPRIPKKVAGFRSTTCPFPTDPRMRGAESRPQVRCCCAGICAGNCAALVHGEMQMLRQKMGVAHRHGDRLVTKDRLKGG